MSFLNRYLGITPNVVRASLMFNKASGVYWNATGTLRADNNYTIDIYEPFLGTEKETFKFRDQHGLVLGSVPVVVECFYLRSVSQDRASNLKECVEKLAYLQKGKEDAGFTPETHFFRPRFSAANLKDVAANKNILIPVLK